MAVETLQHPWELDRLLEVVDTIAPRRILEIGTWEGGTLLHWLKPGRLVVVVDDEMRRRDEWESWAADRRASFMAIQGKSQDPVVVTAVESLGPFDLVFIDADHRYEAGFEDWKNYAPMVREGGILAFHDIRRYEHGDLDRLWQLIKADHCTSEYHEPHADWGGIGIVWL